MRGGGELHDPKLVGERIAEPDVDPVFALGELVHDLHALCLELSSKVFLASLVVKSMANPLAPLLISSRTCSADLGSIPGGPGSSRSMSREGSPGTLTVSQRMTPRSRSLLTSSPSLPT